MVPVMILPSSPQNSVQPAPAHSGPTARPGLAEDGRLCKHADYQRVYKSTRKQFSASMTWFAALRPTVPQNPKAPPVFGPRVGLTAGKVLGKAHERNRIKRRMRAVVRQHLHELPSGLDLILHPRRFVMDMEFGKLDAEVLRIFRQARAQIASQTSQKPKNATVAEPNTAS